MSHFDVNRNLSAICFNLELLQLASFEHFKIHSIHADIDECNSTATHDCEQICRNTEGSFECDCMSGYQPEAASPNLCEGR